MFELFVLAITSVTDFLTENAKKHLPDVPSEIRIVSDNVDELFHRPKSGLMTAICTHGIIGTKKTKKVIKKKLKRLGRSEESRMPRDRSFGIRGISQEIYEHKKFKHQLEVELSDIKEPAYKDLRSGVKDVENLQVELKNVRKWRYAQRKLSKLNTAMYKELCKDKDKLQNELEKLKDEAKELREEEKELEAKIQYFQKLCCFAFCICVAGVLNFLL